MTTPQTVPPPSVTQLLRSVVALCVSLSERIDALEAEVARRTEASAR